MLLIALIARYANIYHDVLGDFLQTFPSIQHMQLSGGISSSEPLISFQCHNWIIAKMQLSSLSAGYLPGENATNYIHLKLQSPGQLR
jgi:hypothetical protein